MKFWTIQNKKIKAVIERAGVYQPDFKYSKYPKMDERWCPLYNYVLQSYNEIHKKNYPGLIFAFAKSDNNKEISEYDNIESFRKHIFQKRISIYSILDDFDEKNDALFELEYSDDINPLFIDINDFQEIKAPIEFNSSYSTYDNIIEILLSIKYGFFIPSKLPSGIIQAHLPNIRRNNIIGEYDVNLIKFTT